MDLDCKGFSDKSTATRPALEAGAKEFQPVQDILFFLEEGDRAGKFTDLSGALWGVWRAA